VEKFMTGIFHIVVARKPIEGTIVENCLQWGCGAINIDGTRIGTETRPALEKTGRSGKIYGSGLEGSRSIGETTLGRWPANLVVGGEETVRKFPMTAPSKKNKTSDGRSVPFMQAGGEKTGGFSGRHDPLNSYDDSGSAARFFFNISEQESDAD
jgi:site-specific DNA-methyltransferase (adenine-specific)